MAEVGAEQKPGVWETFRDAPAAAKTIMVGVVVNRLSGFLVIFLVLFVSARGFSTAQAVFALGAYGAGGVVGTVVGGALSDRFGPRVATAISMGVSGLLIAFMLVPSQYPLLVVASALVGVASQIFRPASATLLSDLTPADNQVMIFAIWRFGLNLGTAVAPLLGFALYYLDDKQYTLVFLTEAGVAVAYAVAAWLLLPHREAARAMAEPEDGEAESKPARGGYLAVLRNRRYAIFLLVAAVHTIVYQQYLSTLPLTVNEARLDIFWYTLAVSVNGIVVILLELPSTKLVQRMPMRLSIAIGLALVGLGVGFYGLPMVPLVILGGTLLWTLGEIVSAPSLFAYPAVVGAGRLKSRYIGSFQFAFGLGNTVAPLVGGWLFLVLGTSVLWPLLGAVEVLVAVAMLTLVRVPKKESPEVSAGTA
ncbi:MFS transporter [Amycolatopsis alba]|uniref:MFS transporter n=1 Tax=Amycolatopsis alba DSM 44262 TaxID=1125972 RepID=A0A229RPU8_AMYAL|nr:MFS transporter [Amycolatopsis alba]OXM48501.1 MFS transporter [Amycolatopsis alba DSM 44262]